MVRDDQQISSLWNPPICSQLIDRYKADVIVRDLAASRPWLVFAEAVESVNHRRSGVARIHQPRSTMDDRNQSDKLCDEGTLRFDYNFICGG
jgi:hypothetical protein